MGGTARRRGRRKAAERDLSAPNWAEVAESHQGRRQGPATRPEAGAGLRWAASGRGSAPGRRTEPRPSARSGSRRSVLERLSHGPAASVFSVAGALSCLHHHQRPTASLPALSFFPCQYSLHFYRDAFFRILVRLAFRRPPVSRGVTGKWLCDMAAPRCRNVFAWLQLSALALRVLRGGHGLSCCGAPVRLPAPRGRGRCGAFSAVPGLTPPARHVSSTDSNAGTCRGGLCFTSPLCAPASPVGGPRLCLMYLCVPGTRPDAESAPWMFAEWTRVNSQAGKPKPGTDIPWSAGESQTGRRGRDAAGQK